MPLIVTLTGVDVLHVLPTKLTGSSDGLRFVRRMVERRGRPHEEGVEIDRPGDGLRLDDLRGSGHEGQRRREVHREGRGRQLDAARGAEPG